MELSEAIKLLTDEEREHFNKNGGWFWVARIADLRAQLAQRDEDAELGRLVRKMPAGMTLFREYGEDGDDGIVMDGTFTAYHDHEGNDCQDTDPLRALRAALGEAHE